MSSFAIEAARCRSLARFPLTRAWAKRRFSRLLRDLNPPPVVQGEVAGLPVSLDLSKGWDRKIFLHGLGDARGVLAMTRIMDLIDCRTAWDIGANRGNHSAAMAGHCRRLHAFEPDPTQFPRLSSLLAAAPNATPFNVGLSDISGDMPFYFHTPGASASFERRSRAPDAIAQVMRGDNFARDHQVEDLDFIKIDVEGHELFVLRGLNRVIADQRPVIMLEILASKAGGRRPGELMERLPGYELFGNYYGLASRVWMAACHFGRFHEGQTYTHALAVPRERLGALAPVLPRWARPRG